MNIEVTVKIGGTFPVEDGYEVPDTHESVPLETAFLIGHHDEENLAEVLCKLALEALNKVHGLT